MATITTGSFPKSLEVGVRKWTHMAYSEHPMELTRVFGNLMTSSKKYEEMVEGTGFPMAPVKPEGEATTYVGHNQGPTTRATHVAYGLGFVVTREARDDNQYAELARQRARAMGFAFRQTKETVFANVLNRAFTAAYAWGDGKELCATDHPVAGGGTQSNELATPADLTEASLEDLMIQIEQAQNNMNLKIRITPDMLIVPPALTFEADRIVNSSLRPGTANNDINALRGKIPGGVMVYHYLDDDDAWFIKTDAPDGLMGFQRVAFETKRDGDFDTDNAKFKGYERYVPIVGDWRGVFASPGA